jgi:hypothetical protein
MGALSGASTDPMELAIYTSASGFSGGAERMRIDSTGNVGIGTTSPGAKLDVNGEIAIRGGESSDDARMYFRASDQSNRFTIETDLDGNTNNDLLGFRSASTDNILVLKGNGNVGIGTTSPAHKLDVSGNVKISSGGLAIENTSSHGYVALPGGAFYHSTSGAETGAIKITLPTHGTGDMLSFVVDIFDYTTNESFTVNIKGYLYQTTGNNEWVNVSAQTIASNINRNFTVRFGADGSNNCVWIGETNSFWSYPQIQVRDFTAGFSADMDSYIDGWDVDIVTSFNTVDLTYFSPFPMSKEVYGSGIHLRGSGSSYFNGGNVGIGTTSPGQKLEVEGNIRISKSNDITSGFELGRDGSTLDAFIIQRENADLFFRTNNSERMRIEAGGNVGIGTTSPVDKLDVRGTARITSPQANDWIVLAQNSATGAPSGFWDSNGNVHLYLRDSSSNTNVLIRPDSTSYFNGGNVGIGVSSPSTKLQVSGTVKSKGLDVDGLANSSTNFLQYTRTDLTQPASMSYDGTGGFDFNLNGGTVKFSDTNGGSVGIGTTSPQEKLHVQNYTTGESHQAMFKGGAVTVGDYSYISLNNGYSTEYNKEVRLAAVSEQSNSNKTGFAVLTSPDSNGASGHERLRVTADGNVGIGTTSPFDRLEVAAANSQLRLRDTDDNNFAQFSYSSGKLVVRNNSTTTTVNQFTLDSIGRMGIGTTSPAAKLEVEQSNSGTDTVFLSNSYNNKGFRTGNAGYATFSGYQDGNNTSSGNAYGALIGLNTFYNGTSFYNDNQYVDPSSILFKDGDIKFHTNDVSSSGNFTPNERLRITKAGNVGIGTTSPTSRLHVQQTLASPSVPMVYFEADRGPSAYGATNVRVDNLDYGYGMRFYKSGIYDSSAISFVNGSSNVGSISIGTSSTSYNTTSDYRLKENVASITDGITRLKQLQPKRFNFIGDTSVVDGFIAHEAKQVVPEAVTGEKDEVLPNGDPVYQGIDQAKLVPLLTAALQDAITKIEELETRIQTLENN